jgi:hypothetical protein
MVGSPLPPFGHPPPQAGEGSPLTKLVTAKAVPPSSLRGAKRRGNPVRSMRSAATLFYLRWGMWTNASFLPPPFFNQRRCAPDGWKPSPGLRPPSPASGGGKCPSEECAIAKAAPLVIARAAPTSSLRGPQARGNPVRSTRRAAPLNKKGEAGRQGILVHFPPQRKQRRFAPHGTNWIAASLALLAMTSSSDRFPSCDGPSLHRLAGERAPEGRERASFHPVRSAAG